MDFTHIRFVLSALFLILLSSLYACSSGSGPSAPTDIPIPIEGLDGASGVAVNSSFTWEPDAEIDTSTVTMTSFFIVPTLGSASGSISVAKSTFSSTICSASHALDASVSCESSMSCTLNPTSDLAQGTAYTICLLSDILYASGEAITAAAITFVSESDAFGVALVTDEAGKPLLQSGSTGAFPSSYTIFFTDTPGDTNDLINIACDLPSGSTLAQPTHDTTLNNSSITLSIEDAYKYQLLDCTLMLDASLPSGSGATLGSDVAYSFTNACAVSDDFNAESTACWEVMTGGAPVENPTWSTWPDLLANALTFDTANSTLKYSNGTNSDFAIYKTAHFSPSGFSLTLNVTPVATPERASDLLVVSAGTFDTEFVTFTIGMIHETGQLKCRVEYIRNFGGVAENANYATPCPLGEELYSIQLDVSSASALAQYSSDGVTYAALPASEGTLPSGQDLLDVIEYFTNHDGMIIYLSGNDGVAASTFDNLSFLFNRVRVEGQYNDE